MVSFGWAHGVHGNELLRRDVRAIVLYLRDDTLSSRPCSLGVVENDFAGVLVIMCMSDLTIVESWSFQSAPSWSTRSIEVALYLRKRGVRLGM